MNSIQTAIRNQITLAWLNSCHADFRQRLICDRAFSLRCPVREIDSEFSSQSEIDWLYESYQNAIELFIEDNKDVAF